jgi:uncharacterized membrane protein
MGKVLIVIPIMTFLAIITILLGVPILREIIVFIFLSFIPGFTILGLFKLKEISFLENILFSAALSIALVMFMGLLVNELYLVLGFSQALSTVPLTVAMSAFTLTAFFIAYRRDLSETSKLKTSFEGKLKNVLPLSIILFLLPLLSAIGVLYYNILLILLSEAVIAALCVMSVVSRRLIPEDLFPFLIFSISIALLCQVLLISKYIWGWDINTEYYVFRLTQINGHWGPLNANINNLTTLTYNSMLSITLLPAVYSALMHAPSGITFQTLYPFIFSLVPLTMYRICEKEFGKLIGLLSALFFVFTYSAFYGVTGINRQIVGDLFFILSILLLISKTIPVRKRRLLLIIFGAALAVSHYSLAFIYLALIALVFIISRAKPRFDDSLNAVTVLLLFLITFSWYSIGPSSPLISLANTIKGTFEELSAPAPAGAITASTSFATPKVFTVASWINLLLSVIANLLLIIGILSIIVRALLRPKGKGIFGEYIVMTVMAAIILAASVAVPRVASILNFDRVYGITLLILSPCFVLGGQAVLTTMRKAWTKIKRALKRQIASKSKNVDLALLLIAIIIGGYFLSQVGFVNRVTGGAVHTYNTYFDLMIKSNNSQVKITLYDAYIPEQDVFSASWLSSHKVETAEVFADYISEGHALVSYGLIPNELLLPITNTTIPPQGSFIYLGSLNIVDGVIITSSGSFNTSEISFLLDQNNLVYSNGNSQIWYVAH